MKIRVEIALLESDPDLAEGDFVTLERADGRRGVWRQRLRLVDRHAGRGSIRYYFRPVDVFDQ